MYAIVMPMRHILLLLAILFGVSALMPTAHQLLHTEESCEVCLVSESDVPVLTANCDGPCGDPTHHHHTPHDLASCATCQSINVTHLYAALQANNHFRSHSNPLMPTTSQRPICAADMRIESARAPPTSILT